MGVKRWVPSILFLLIASSPLVYYQAGMLVYSQVAKAEPTCESHAPYNRPDNFTIHPWDESVEVPSSFLNSTLIDTEMYWMEHWQNLTIQVPDEPIQLSAWAIENSSSDEWVIIVHGIRSCKANHESLIPAGMLHKNGFNVLLIDMRDHWQSTLEDGRVSAGQKEWRDVLAAWNYLVEDKGVNETKIGIHGTSMGAATTAIAFAQEPQIQAAFLDSSFSSMEKIMVEELQFQGYPEFLKDAAVFAGIVSTGENIIEHEPLSATQSISNRHLFITQSTIDSRIRLHHGEKLCEVARENSDGGSVHCWLEESAFEFTNEDGEQGSLAHVSLMITQSELYEQRLVAFFEQALF